VFLAAVTMALIGWASIATPGRAVAGDPIAAPTVTCPDPVSWCSGFTHVAALSVANAADSSLLVIARTTVNRSWAGFPRTDSLRLAAFAETTLTVPVDVPLAEPRGAALMLFTASLADSAQLRETCALEISINDSLVVTAAASGPVCAGDDVDLTAGVLPGASYAWTGPAGFTSNVRTPVIEAVRPDQAGRYCVTARRGGCVSRSVCANLVVRVPPAIQAAANGPLTFGDTLRLSATAITGADYEWFGPFGFGSTEREPTLPVVQPLNSGTYCVRVTNIECDAPEVCVDVRVRPSEVVLETLQVGRGTVRMVWRSPGAAGVPVVLKRREGLEPAIALATLPFGLDDRLIYEDRTVAPGREYAYRLCATRDPLEYCFEEVEATTPAGDPLRITPNPARQALGIEITVPTSAGAALDLIDVTGRVKRTIPLSAGTGYRRITIPVGTDLRPGLYLVRLRAGDLRTTRRAFVVP
jgi:hypothetical protein